MNTRTNNDIDPNQFCSPARRFLLQVHGAYHWCCRQVARPFIALLNAVDETPRFASHLRLRQEEERRAAELYEANRFHHGGRIML